MANTIRIKRSAIQGKVPAISDLSLGELALNTYHGKLYTLINDGTESVVEIGTNASTLDGQQGSYYQPASTALTTSTTFGGDVSGTYNAIVVANDSHTHDGRYYTEAESDARYLGISAKAADSNLLDGIDSGSFLRSDATDTATGVITFSNEVNMNRYGNTHFMHGGNYDTYITYGAAAGGVYFRTYNGTGYSTKLTLDNSGNLGIGTSPTEKLHVAGSALVTGNITNGGFDFILGNTDQSSRGDSGSSRALVKHTGNVLAINFAGDFDGGTRIDSALTVVGSMSAGGSISTNLGLITANTASGYIQIGAITTSFANITTDLGKFYFNKPITVDDTISSFNADLLLYANNFSTLGVRVTNSGATTLYYNSGAKLATASDGIDVTGNARVTTAIYCDEINDRTGQQLVLNAGEAQNKFSGQTGEYVYVNAESGLWVSTPDRSHSNFETGYTQDSTIIQGHQITINGNTVFHAGNDGSGSGLDADTLDGQQGSYYLNTSTQFGGDVSGTYNAIVVANDSHTHDGRYYTETESDARFLGISAKAADSNLLDGIDSSSFLRSDAADTGTGLITLTNGLNVTGSNVGIGTTNPLAKLDVRGNINIGGENAGPNYIAFRGTTGDNPGGYNHTYIGERIWGTTERSELLLFKGNDSTQTTNGDRVRIVGGEIRLDTYSTATSGTFEEVATSANVNNVVTINSDGNVGIGTTNPTEKLEVSGNTILDANNATLKLKSGVTGTRGAIDFTFNTDSTVYGSLDLDYDTRATIGLRLYANYPLTFETGTSTIPIIFKQGSANERARIDSSGRLLVGTSSALTGYGYTPQFQILGSSAGTASSLIEGLGTPVYPTYSRTNAGNTAVVNNDAIFQLRAYGFDGANRVRAAAIECAIDGTPGTNDMPGRIVLSTTASGASAPTERMRIDSSGRVGIGTTSPSELLSVAGNAILSDNAFSPGEIYYFALGDKNAFISNEGGSTVKIGSYNGTVFGRCTTNNATLGTEWARFDSSGRLLVGTSSSFQIENIITPKVISANNTGSGSCADLFVGSFQNAAGAGRARVSGKLFLAHSRSNVTGSIGGIVGSTDRLGEIRFVGDDGTQFLTAAEILGEVDGVPGTDDMPGRLVFSTTADGASSPTERMRITSAGLVGIGTSSPTDTKLQVGDDTTFVSTANNVKSMQAHVAGLGNSYFAYSTVNYSANAAYLCAGFKSNAPDAASSAFLATTGAGTDGRGGTVKANIKHDGSAYFAGSVGIGTSSPVNLLHVQGDATFEQNTGGQFAIRGSSNSSNRFNFGFDTTGNYAWLQAITAGTAYRPIALNPAGGNVGIGTTSPGGTLDIKAATSTTPLIVQGPSSEFARIDSSGRLLVGTSSALSVANITAGLELHSIATNNGTSLSLARFNDDNGAPQISLAKSRNATINAGTIVQDNDLLGTIHFAGDDGTDLNTSAAYIQAFVDGTPGANDMPGRLVFSTTADGANSATERMRINNAGDLIYGTGGNGIDPGTGTVDGIYFNNTTKQWNASRNGGAVMLLRRRTSDGSIVGLYRDTTQVGSISVTTTATAYNTSSDYRLKENILPVTDGITRLQQLKPSRFNFIADPDKTVDGFLAHEVQDVVPEAITGEKDAVDEEGNPEYQGIDQSKLVPLLTAALQEAVGRIETLEAEVAALKA